MGTSGLRRSRDPLRHCIGVTGSDYFLGQVRRIAFVSSRWKLTDLTIPTRHDPGASWATFREQLIEQDLWYRIAGYFSVHSERACLEAYRLGIPVVIHWTGSDILAFSEFVSKRPESLKFAREFTHWATAPWLVDELAQLGLQAFYVAFPIYKRVRYLDQPPLPLPEQFSIYSYIPDNQPDLYGWRHIERLAVEFPSVEINVVGGNGTRLRRVPDNIRFHGWVVNVDDLYARTTVTVRMTRHDGLTGSVQEPLILGRYAVWTYPFPGALHATDYSQLREHIQGLLDSHLNGRLNPNLVGRDYISQKLSPKILARRLQERVLTVLRRSLHHGGHGESLR